MNAAEIRGLAREEIEKEISDARAKLFRFRFQSENEENQRKGDIGKLRRTIARCMTILRERELEEAKRVG